MRREFIAVPAAVLALAVCAPAQATTTTITTNTYDSTSTSDNIAVSCKNLQIEASTGILDGECNVALDTLGGQVVANEHWLDLDTAIHCHTTVDGVVELAFGRSVSYDGSIKDWKIFVVSTGDGYTVEAECNMNDGTGGTRTALDLGNTTDGLKNEAGAFMLR